MKNKKDWDFIGKLENGTYVFKNKKTKELYGTKSLQKAKSLVGDF